MNNGFINIHRKMLNNPISKKPAWAWLWIYLLLRANWSETEIIWNGKTQKISKGSLITGRNSLSIETGIPRSTIEDILKYLETQHQIRQQKNNKYRVITIVNWEKYQKPDIKSDNKATSSRHLADTDNNNNKNNKNKKEHIAETSSAQTPFSLQSAIERLYDSPRRDLNVIALYLEERKPDISSAEQLSTVIKRHLRPAKLLSPFTDEQILNAIPKAKSMTSEWTIETLIKIVTK
jgi:hypothetical protein